MQQFERGLMKYEKIFKKNNKKTEISLNFHLLSSIKLYLWILKSMFWN